jgi:hypothetical protein
MAGLLRAWYPQQLEAPASLRHCRSKALCVYMSQRSTHYGSHYSVRYFCQQCRNLQLLYLSLVVVPTKVQGAEPQR